jgi:transposase
VVTKNGKAHEYWRLVRSIRRDGKVVQETVAQLGELDAEGRTRARMLARRITGRSEQRELFEELPAEQTVSVRLDKVGIARMRSFGDVWLGWRLWQALELDRALDELLPPGRETVPWSQMAAVLVIARLCEPSSELYVAENWYRRTALEDILGLPSERVNDDRLYRALDELLPHKEAIELHLKKRLGALFNLDYDLLLYDVTSTYFEGLAEGNELALRGHSRDHRPDCKQVCIALVVTREGIPLSYEVFAGNRNDVTTVEEIVETMEQRFGLAKRIWVMDRGMSSEETLTWLQETGRRYIIGTPKSEMKRWSRQIADAQDWKEIRDGIEVKLCAGPDGQETFLLCRSVERREKEQAIHERFIKRMEASLTKMARRLEHAKRPIDRDKAHQQIGRMCALNSRAAGRYLIKVVHEPMRPSGARLDWSVKPEWDEWARHTEGCYVLRTNVHEWTPETLWRTYIQLTEAEAAFRIQKSELSLRPVWHQKAERVEAHIFVCFLAYVLWKTLEQWQKRAELGHSPRTILDEIKRIQSTDVVLPLANEPGRELRIRCVVRPDKAQAALLDRLGIRLPERLKIPAPIAKM